MFRVDLRMLATVLVTMTDRADRRRAHSNFATFYPFKRHHLIKWHRQLVTAVISGPNCLDNALVITTSERPFRACFRCCCQRFETLRAGRGKSLNWWAACEVISGFARFRATRRTAYRDVFHGWVMFCFNFLYKVDRHYSQLNHHMFNHSQQLRNNEINFK